MTDITGDTLVALGEMVLLEEKALIHSFIAGGTITKGRAVVFDTDNNEVKQAAAAGNALGIALEAAVEGDYLSVLMNNGIVKVEVSGAIDAGVAVQTHTDGTIVALADQAVDEGGSATYTVYYARKLGIALNTATADGDYIYILVAK